MSETTENNIREIFSAQSGQLSSKRVIGVIAWLVVLGLYIFSAVTQKPLPDGTGEILFGATSLLGVDSVAGAFRR